MNLINQKLWACLKLRRWQCLELKKGGQFEISTFGMIFASLGDHWLANGVFPLTKP